MRDASVCCLENNKQYAPQSQMMTLFRQLEKYARSRMEAQKLETKTNYSIKEI